MFQAPGTYFSMPTDATKITRASSQRQPKRRADSLSTRSGAGDYCRAVRPQTPHIGMLKEEFPLTEPTYPPPPFDSSLADAFEDLKIEIRDRRRTATRSQLPRCLGTGANTFGVCRGPFAQTAPIVAPMPKARPSGNTVVKFTEHQNNAGPLGFKHTKRHRTDVVNLLDDTIVMLTRIDRLWTPGHGRVPADSLATAEMVVRRLKVKANAKFDATAAAN